MPMATYYKKILIFWCLRVVFMISDSDTINKRASPPSHLTIELMVRKPLPFFGQVLPLGG